MPKIKIYVNTGFVGANHVDYEEIDDDEWAGMSEAERDALLDEMALDYMNTQIDYGAYVVESKG